MNAARLHKSQRLQRVLATLQDGREHTTRDIMLWSDVCAGNSCIAELRANGHEIVCRRKGDRWTYQLTALKAA